MSRGTVAKSLPGLAVFAAALISSNASARPTGEPQACANCHYETEGPMVGLVFSEPSPGTGETVTVTVEIEAVNAEAMRTGLFLSSSGGAFSLIEPEATRFAMDGDATAVLHAQPRDLDGQGQAEFQFEWTTPDEVGITDFTLWSMTGNTNGDSADDHHVTMNASVAHGCDAVVYYPDLDGDGFGDVDSPTLSCDPIEGQVVQGGDCNDGDAEIYPDATERCNAQDDDCDGEADEGLEPGIYYPDPDGDGFAGSLDMPEFTCNDADGFASEAGDCAPDDPDVYPGAPETENGVDDDCDGEIDEDIEEEPTEDESGGGGTGVSMETGGGTGTGPSAADDGGSAGGCRVGGVGGSAGAPWLLGLLAVAGGRRRRRRG